MNFLLSQKKAGPLETFLNKLCLNNECIINESDVECCFVKKFTLLIVCETYIHRYIICLHISQYYKTVAGLLFFVIKY